MCFCFGRVWSPVDPYWVMCFVFYRHLFNWALSCHRWQTVLVPPEALSRLHRVILRKPDRFCQLTIFCRTRQFLLNLTISFLGDTSGSGWTQGRCPGKLAISDPSSRILGLECHLKKRLSHQFTYVVRRGPWKQIIGKWYDIFLRNETWYMRQVLINMFGNPVTKTSFGRQRVCPPDSPDAPPRGILTHLVGDPDPPT